MRAGRRPVGASREARWHAKSGQDRADPGSEAVLATAAGVANAVGALLTGDRGRLAGLGARPRALRTGSRSSSRATPGRVGATVGDGERPAGRVKVLERLTKKTGPEVDGVNTF